MGQPYPVRYTVVPVIGPDGVGKTSLLQALGGYLQQRDHLPAPPVRFVQTGGSNALVLDVRGDGGFHQLVDFASAEEQPGLLRSTPFPGAVLVVSAPDSIVPATLDILMAAREAGIARIALALTKCNLVEDPEMLDLVTMEVREVLEKYGCGDAAPVVCVGAGAEGRAAERWWRANGELLQAVQTWIP